MGDFLHMHQAMADKALMIEITRKNADPWSHDMAVLRSIVMSGEADYRSRHENVTVTKADRELVCRYLAA